jgi:energy-converting hydrogenase Eha subunit A
MSTISLVITIAGAAATLLFTLGFLRGLKNAIAGRNQPAPKSDDDEISRFPTALFAVVASAVVIAAVGFTPVAIYVGPFLAIVTAAGVGLAFFLEPKPGR